MDTLSVARQAAALGLLPADAVKTVLASTAVSPLLPASKSQPIIINEAALLRALLYEALLFLLRSLSHLVAYEAAMGRDQFSWGAVTLYYANYYCALGMNRLAGEAVSTVSGGGTYQVRLTTAPSLFTVERIEVNNHKEVWGANFRLYETFNWRDTSLDGTIVRVPIASRWNHPERKAREEINYHPESYKEIMAAGAAHRRMKRICGNYYSVAPDVFGPLPFSDPFDRRVAMFECHAVARQRLLLAIFGQVFNALRPFPSSRFRVHEMVRQFSRNYLTQPPFRSRLNLLYQGEFDQFNL